jgi:hypothetical protein
MFEEKSGLTDDSRLVSIKNRPNQQIQRNMKPEIDKDEDGSAGGEAKMSEAQPKMIIQQNHISMKTKSFN